MARLFLVLVFSGVSWGAAGGADGAEVVPAAAIAAPGPMPAPISANRQAAAMQLAAARQADARAAAAHQYFYVDFPRQLAAVQQATQLAEAEVLLVARRLQTYAPMRSFGRYGATYAADYAWQTALLAATQRVQCLRDQEADLWRQRRLLAEQWALSASP